VSLPKGKVPAINVEHYRAWKAQQVGQKSQAAPAQ
jgi:hypothetical protein